MARLPFVHPPRQRRDVGTMCSLEYVCQRCEGHMHTNARVTLAMMEIWASMACMPQTLDAPGRPRVQMNMTLIHECADGGWGLANCIGAEPCAK